MLRQGALERLNQKLNSKLQAIPAQIRSRRKEKPGYLELVALPIARVSESTRLNCALFIVPPAVSSLSAETTSRTWSRVRQLQ